MTSELERIYSRRFDAEEDYRNLVWKTLIAGWFQAQVPRDAAVLDLGCGYGQFINNVACGRKYAMDANPASRGKLNPDVQFLEQNCAEPWNLASGSLDVVFTSNFFEHLLTKADLMKTILEAKRCLRKGGRIIAMGPNIKFLPGSYWDFYDHYLPLTELSMKEALETAGFQAKMVLDRFLPYTMVNAPKYPVALMRVYMMVPLLWKFFGKQFVVSASR